MMKRNLNLVAAALLLLLTAGCASQEGSYEVMSRKAETSSSVPSMEMAGSVGSDNAKTSLASADYNPINLSRSIIRTGSQTIYVDDIDIADNEISRILNQARGYSESDNISSPKARVASNTYTIRVPVDQFDSVLDQFAELGWQENRSTSSDDVTDQLFDIEARLKAARLQENAFVKIMDRAQKIEDVLKVQRELLSVRTMIEQMEAQQLGLNRRVAMSTIHLSVHENETGAAVPTNPNWVQGSVAAGSTSLQSFGRGLGSTLIYLGVTSPIWIVPAGLIWFAVWRSKRTKSRRTPPVTSA
jgi:hypothetical protein